MVWVLTTSGPNDAVAISSSEGHQDSITNLALPTTVPPPISEELISTSKVVEVIRPKRRSKEEDRAEASIRRQLVVGKLSRARRGRPSTDGIQDYRRIRAVRKGVPELSIHEEIQCQSGLGARMTSRRESILLPMPRTNWQRLQPVSRTVPSDFRSWYSWSILAKLFCRLSLALRGSTTLRPALCACLLFASPANDTMKVHPVDVRDRPLSKNSWVRAFHSTRTGQVFHL